MQFSKSISILIQIIGLTIAITMFHFIIFPFTFGNSFLWEIQYDNYIRFCLPIIISAFVAAISLLLRLRPNTFLKLMLSYASMLTLISLSNLMFVGSYCDASMNQIDILIPFFILLVIDVLLLYFAFKQLTKKIILTVLFTAVLSSLFFILYPFGFPELNDLLISV